MLNLNNNVEFSVTRTCKDCKNIDALPLTKLEAAFELYDSVKFWNSRCSKCGSSNCASTNLYGPKLDQEILDIWGSNSELTFMPQDEELLLAEVEYFPMVLKAIDESKYLKNKISVLVESICVLLYDNIAHVNEYSDDENKSRNQIAEMVRPELIKRKNLITANESSIMDYIKEIVFPQIGLEYTNDENGV